MSRATTLAARLREAAEAVIAVVETVDPEPWRLVPGPGIWSVGKEVEHVAEAAVYHQWIVHRTIGQTVASRRPAIERTRMSTDLSPREAIELVRRRSDKGVRLLLELTEEQLDRPTRPRRANAQRLAVTIERVLIGHYDAHRAAIEAKLRGALPLTTTHNVDRPIRAC